MLTRRQLERHLDGAIEIVRPYLHGLEAVEIITAMLFLKALNDRTDPGDTPCVYSTEIHSTTQL